LTTLGHANAGALRKQWFRDAFAHHPECAAFDDDVIRWRGHGVCASCIAMAAGFLAASSVLAWAVPRPDNASVFVAGGIVVGALAQSLSALRFTTTKRRKILVKTLVGFGVAAALFGLAVVAWPAWLRTAVFVAAATMAALLAVPRVRRLREMWHQHGHDERCDVSGSPLQGNQTFDSRPIRRIAVH